MKARIKKKEMKKLTIEEAKNIVVTCKDCKRKFKLGEGYGYSYESNKYLCLNCLEHLKDL